MNWKYIKIVMIVLLLAVNLFLLATVIDYYTDKNFTDGETAKEAAAVLQKGGINVSPDLLSVKSDTAKSYSYSYVRDEYLYLGATAFLGREPDGVYLLPDGIHAENENGDTAILRDDLSFSYCKSGADISEATDTLNRLASGVETEAKSEKASLAEMLGKEDENFVCESAFSADGKVLITVLQCNGGIPIYDMRCTFCFEDGTLCCASGKYFFGESGVASEAQLLSRVNILFSEKKSGSVGEVARIELCYALYENSDSDTIWFLPSYAVYYADGTVSVRNGISGEKY